MGVEYHTSRFLLQARSAGHRFGRALTIGRQNFVVTSQDLEKLAREFRFDLGALHKFEPRSALTYVEPFLSKALGADAVESIDVSTYEGATHLHDMNAPLPAALKGKFDTVLEAGSLEHIFNFPIAIRNLMEALRPGGSLFLQTPANNYFGHGFYQFSPELFYRVFSEENGFEVKRMEAVEHFYPAHFFATQPFAVSDPKKIGERVQLVNARPTLLLIEARRVSEKPIFEKTPQQSDYVPLWRENASAMPTEASEPVALRRDAKAQLYSVPLKLVGWLWLQHFLNRRSPYSFSNRRFFQRRP